MDSGDRRAPAVGMLSVVMADYRNRHVIEFNLVVMELESAVGLAGWIMHLHAIDDWWDWIVLSAPVLAPVLVFDLAILATIGLAGIYATSSNQESLPLTKNAVV